MTVKELKEGIRRLTRSVNEKIAEYRERNLTNRFFDRQLERLKQATSYVRNSQRRVPKGRTGELGLGFSGKVKTDLERQYRELEAFNTKEWRSTAAERERSAKADKAYKTFKRRYGEISFDEWEDLVYMMDDVKNYIADFGYEDIGGSVARAYVENRNKKNFLQQIRTTANRVKGQGITPEDFIDELTEVLIEEGAIDE